MTTILPIIANFLEAIIKIHPQMPSSLNEQIKTMHAFLKNYQDKQFFLIQNFVKRLIVKSNQHQNVYENSRTTKPVQIQTHSQKYIINRARTQTQLLNRCQSNKENQKNHANFSDMNYTQPHFKLQNPKKFFQNSSINNNSNNMIQSKSNKSFDKIKKQMHKIDSIFFKQSSQIEKQHLNKLKSIKKQVSQLNIKNILADLNDVHAMMTNNHIYLQNFQQKFLNVTQQCLPQRQGQKVLIKSQSTQNQQPGSIQLIKTKSKQKQQKKKKLRINFKAQAQPSNENNTFNQITSSV